MPCRMTAPFDFLTDLADRQIPSQNPRQQAGLSYAGRTAEGRHLLRQKPQKRIYPFPFPGRYEIHVISAVLIKSPVLFCRIPVQVTLIKAELWMDAGVFTRHEHFIHQELVGVR